MRRPRSRAGSRRAFDARARRACSCASRRRWRRASGARASRRCGAGSTSTPSRQSIDAALRRPARRRRACACRAASTPSSSRCAPCSASRSRWRRRARWRARARRALRHAAGHAVARARARLFPSPAALAAADARAASPSWASSAAAPRADRAGPGVARARSRCCSRARRPTPLIARAVRAARHRPVDGALHRDARARLARCLPARRRGRAEGACACCAARAHAARRRRARAGLAALARLRRAAPVEQPAHRSDRRHAERRLRTDRSTEPPSHRLHRADRWSTPRSARCCWRAPRTAWPAPGSRARSTTPARSPRRMRADDPLLRRAVARSCSATSPASAAAFDLPLDLHGTPFQRAVWQALLRIAGRAHRSYGEIARRIGRAAGGARRRRRGRPQPGLADRALPPRARQRRLR